LLWEQIVARDEEIQELSTRPLKSLPSSDNQK